MKDFLKVIPLGGLGEVGRNMMALELGKDIIIIDSGVSFPNSDMPGVDLVIPDIEYLLANRSKVRAILITHGHEDHTGALPFVLSELNVPVYAPQLAHGLISVKLKEHRLLKSVKLVIADSGKQFKFGRFRVEFFPVCHSIPDAMGLAIDTNVGTVIHTGDFKIDHTPADGNGSDLSRLSYYGSKGVLLLLSDSTYSEVPGYTPSESVVGEALDIAIGKAQGRVLVATFASLISRIQQVLDAAYKHGRKVAVVGRSMVNNVNMSIDLGYLKPAPGVLLTLADIDRMPSNEVVIITTGSQGEPSSALVRIANKVHKDISVIPGDTVIISASAIPGNETLITKTIDNMFRQGASVLYDKIALVHVHGHASQEELKIMINLTNPRFFVPIHGEYHHLEAHAALAKNMGIPKSNVFVMEDGDVLEINETDAVVTGRVPADYVYIERGKKRKSTNPVYAERKKLSRDGILIVTVSISKDDGHLLGEPEVTAKGMIDHDGNGSLFRDLKVAVTECLNEYLPASRDATKSMVEERIHKLFFRQTGRRPIVLPVIIEF